MRTKTTHVAEPASSSLFLQAQSPIIQHEIDKQTNNPLQQPIWQPGKPASGKTSSASANHGFHFANISVLAPDRLPVQAKLSIGQPNDKYEQEADQVADKVMSMPDSLATTSPRQAGSGSIQRTCSTCSSEYNTAAEEDRPVDQKNLCPQCRVQAKPLAGQITPLIQRKSDNGQEEDEELKDTRLQTSVVPGQSPTVSQEVSSGINTMRGGGKPLPQSMRGFMEPRFGHNFNHVRIHADSNAAKISRQINARAFTVGPNIAFGAGQYQPDTDMGKRLMAHELTHVVQQGAAHELHGSPQVNSKQQIQPSLIQTGTPAYIVQRYPGDGMVPPGDCSWANYLLLRGSVETAKAVVSMLGGCRAGDSCLFLATKIAAISAEIAARVALDATCFKGGDTGHREQVQTKVNMLNRCYRFFNGINCSPELIAAMDLVVQRAREVIAVGAAVVAVALIVALIAAIIALAKVIAALVAAAAAVAAEAAAITAAVTAVIALLVVIKDELSQGESPEA